MHRRNKEKRATSAGPLPPSAATRALLTALDGPEATARLDRLVHKIDEFLADRGCLLRRLLGDLVGAEYAYPPSAPTIERIRKVDTLLHLVFLRGEAQEAVTGVDATAPAARLDGDALTPTRPRAQQPTRHHTQHATTPAPTAASVGPLVNCTINQTNEIMPLMAVVSLTLENLPDDAEAGVNIALRYWPAAMGGSSDDIGKDGAPPAGALWSSVAFLNRSAPAAELNLFRLRAAQLHVAEVWASWPGGESMLETLTWTARGTGVPRFDSGSLAQIEGSHWAGLRPSPDARPVPEGGTAALIENAFGRCWQITAAHEFKFLRIPHNGSRLTHAAMRRIKYKLGGEPASGARARATPLFVCSCAPAHRAWR